MTTENYGVNTKTSAEILLVIEVSLLFDGLTMMDQIFVSHPRLRSSINKCVTQNNLHFVEMCMKHDHSHNLKQAKIFPCSLNRLFNYSMNVNVIRFRYTQSYKASG